MNMSYKTRSFEQSRQCNSSISLTFIGSFFKSNFVAMKAADVDQLRRLFLVILLRNHTKKVE